MSTTVAPAAALSDSVEARGMAMLVRYLHQAPDRSEAEELIARDAFITAWRWAYVRGGRDALDECAALNTALADKRMRNALATLLMFLDTKGEL